MAKSADFVARALKESEVSVANHAIRNGKGGVALPSCVALYGVRLASSLTASLTRQ